MSAHRWMLQPINGFRGAGVLGGKRHQGLTLNSFSWHPRTYNLSLGKEGDLEGEIENMRLHYF